MSEIQAVAEAICSALSLPIPSSHSPSAQPRVCTDTVQPEAVLRNEVGNNSVDIARSITEPAVPQNTMKM